MEWWYYNHYNCWVKFITHLYAYSYLNGMMVKHFILTISWTDHTQNMCSHHRLTHVCKSVAATVFLRETTECACHICIMEVVSLLLPSLRASGYGGTFEECFKVSVVHKHGDCMMSAKRLNRLDISSDLKDRLARNGLSSCAVSFVQRMRYLTARGIQKIMKARGYIWPFSVCFRQARKARFFGTWAIIVS